MFKVMIVDDMDIVRKELRRLKIWGEISDFYISDEAANGEEALAKLNSNPVDLIITDIKMPKINGIELLQKVMEKKLCQCVVFLSDYSSFNYARQGMILGAFDYLCKPVNEEDMVQLLKRAKDSILQIKSEEARIRKLEESLDERTISYNPQLEIKHIFELIRNGNQEAIGYAIDLADMAADSLNKDAVKLKSLMKDALLEIIDALCSQYQWLEKFVDTAEWKNTDFSKCCDCEAIKLLFTESVERILKGFTLLYCGKTEDDIVSQVCRCVLTKVDSDLSLKIVSDSMYMNKTYISEVFKQKTGKSFTEYTTTVKMERAKILLGDNRLKTYEISERLGFRDIEYFSRLFKKHIGLSPTEYRHFATKRH